MYATSTASTTSGSGRALSAAPDDRRVRVVRLLRPRRAAPAFGFSLRGGKEYGAGFFISKVEFNSEAHLQGLKVSRLIQARTDWPRGYANSTALSVRKFFASCCFACLYT